MESKKAILIILVLFGAAPWLLLFYQSFQLAQNGVGEDASSWEERLAERTDERDAAEARAERLHSELGELRRQAAEQEELLAGIRRQSEARQEEQQERLEALNQEASASAERFRELQRDYAEALRMIARMRVEATEREEGASMLDPGRQPARQTETRIPGPDEGETAGFEVPDREGEAGGETRPIPEEPIRSTRGGWMVLGVETE